MLYKILKFITILSSQKFLLKYRKIKISGQTCINNLLYNIA